MTVRFVARLAIAIATLLSSALLCWAQPPSFTQKPAMPTGTRLAQTPAPAGPNLDSPAEGAWISDADNSMPEPPSAPNPDALAAALAQGLTGVPDQGEGCDPNGEPCDPTFGGPPLGHGHFVTDLWEEVHSHKRVYGQVDYMAMWVKGNQLPPLVTTSPLGTPQAQAGVLPVSATTSILFGGERVDQDMRSGGRINLGYWLIDGEFLGVEGQYFALQPGHTRFDATSIFSDGIQPGDQILARPFFNVNPNLPEPRQDAAIVAFPDPYTLFQSQGPLDGSINIKTTSNLQSAGALLRKLIWMDFTSRCRLDLLLGYRFMRYDDSVIIDDAWDFLPNSGIIGPVSFASQDTFSAKNQFHGGELGVKAQKYWGPLSAEIVAKVAFGNNHQTMYIDGFNTITTVAGSSTTAGGLLAQPTNMGTYDRNVFAILPEGNVNLRLDLTANLRATLGYTYVYMNRVQRSGEAINTTVNPTQFSGGTLVGDAKPSFTFNSTPFWAQGATAGIEYRW